MKQQLLNPTVHDKAIETTCRNLALAGLLLQPEVAGYMLKLTGMDDYDLADELITSRLLLDSYYERMAKERRN